MKKKIINAMLLGYTIQLPFILGIVFILYAVRFMDNFYNISWVLGKEWKGLGFLLSLGIALILGIIAETKRGMKIINVTLGQVPIARSITGFVINIVEQVKKFRELARRQGIILASFYRKNSSFWPAIVTNVLPKEKGGYLISIVFIDPPFFRPLLLNEDEIVYTSDLTVKEIFGYALSGGLSLRMSSRKLKDITLGEYIRLYPQIIADK